MAIQTLNDLATLLEQRTKINANFAELESTKYAKPAPGIPSTDMTAGVQASLALANSAIQTAPVTSVAGRTGAITLAKADVGLPNVDNTSDSAKPVSTAQAASIATRAPRANGGGALGATKTTTDADDALNFTAPVACTITVHPGAVQGFGFGVSGPGVVTWAGGAGVTVADKRNSGATNPVCGLAYMGANSFEVWGSKT